MGTKWIANHMCWTCHYSRGTSNCGLVCDRSNQITTGRACPQFDREPGADMPTEQERARQEFWQYTVIARARMIAEGFDPNL